MRDRMAWIFRSQWYQPGWGLGCWHSSGCSLQPDAQNFSERAVRVSEIELVSSANRRHRNKEELLPRCQRPFSHSPN